MSKTKKKDNKQQDEKEFHALLTPLDEDVPYEEEVHRNPYNIRSWTRYLEYKEEASPALRNILHERALRELPGSYKLWFNYLHERRIQVRGLPLNDPSYDSVNDAFERCLQTLHKMPRIWLEYGEFLITQKKVTKTRHVFDRALRALPITQHDRIWKLYAKFASGPYVPFTTSHKIWGRYLKVEPDRVEEYAQYLKSTEQWNEAAVQLIKVVNSNNFDAKTKHDSWMTLCDIIAKYSEKLHNNNIDVDKIVRGGLKQFSEDTGKMWTTLAGYYIRQSLFDKARDIFEEGMDTVVTVKDFSQIWDAYAKFEDGLIAAQVETMDKQEDPEELIDFDLRIARYENLLARQPLLVNSVLLRQNPHNVHEWQKRAALYKGNNRMIVETYSQALSTVDPMKALGKPYFLWIEFAHFYESLGDLDKARKVFEQGTQAPFKTIDDLSTVWCAYAEFEIRQNNFIGARNLLQTATTVPRSVKATLSNEREPVQKRVYRSTKLWALYVDVEESVGTFANTKAVYERILELKVASPQLVINFAHFLEEHKYYEESFKAYEKGISLFKFPHSLDIWVAYLIKFVARYGGKKLERARDLFEQVLAEAPARDSKIFYIMYANLEEEFGLARHAMSVYDRATRAVSEEDRFAIFSLYINRASEFFGVTRTRDIYEQAISILPDQHAKVMAMRYADLERKLGEIDRARAVFIHASQFSDPRTDAQYWMKWREFEVEHGNQDTFREMLRIKRSVQAQLNTSVNVMAAQMLSDKEKEVTKAARPALPPSDMEILERAANLANKERQASEQAAKLHNPEEISVEDEDEEQEIEEPEDVVEEQSVPKAIFERNVPTSATNENKQPLGALARLKRKDQ